MSHGVLVVVPAVSVPPSLFLLPSSPSSLRPAVLWTRRRDQLDRQEAELLRRVRAVRQKVVEHMNSSRGHSRTDTSSQTH